MRDSSLTDVAHHLYLLAEQQPGFGLLTITYRRSSVSCLIERDDDDDVTCSIDLSELARIHGRRIPIDDACSLVQTGAILDAYPHLYAEIQ